jgi:hypothetical protein
VTTKTIASRIKVSFPSCLDAKLKLNQYGQIKAVLVLHQIGREARHHRTRRTGVASRRRDSVFSGEIWDVGRAVIELPAERMYWLGM